MGKTIFHIFYEELIQVKDWDSFVVFFNAQILPMQILIGLVIFGCSYLVWLFFYAMFVDKHN